MTKCSWSYTSQSKTEQQLTVELLFLNSNSVLLIANEVKRLEVNSVTNATFSYVLVCYVCNAGTLVFAVSHKTLNHVYIRRLLLL